MVAPVFLAPIVAEIVRRHVDVRTLFRGLEIEAGDFDMPGALISHGDAVTVVRRALRLLPLAGRGLELGARATITERGALSLGLLAATTLGDAIRLSLRFPQSAGYLLLVRGDSVAGVHQFRAELFPGNQDLQHFLVDLTFAASVQLCRQVTMANYTPALVELVCAAPANPAGYEAFFGCPVRFGRPGNVLSTHADWLDFRLPWANDMASRLSSQWLERDSERLNAMSALGFTVARAIRRGLPDIAELAQVAASLNFSERTLRRQLALAGLSFRYLLDESRKARALDLMASGHRPVAEVAAAAGFSDARAFTRAFKRWTGHPPSRAHDDAVGAPRDPPLSAPTGQA
jgi:AraC-like DNA-binding protein